MSPPKIVVNREICATRDIPVHHVRIVENEDQGGPPVATRTQVFDEIRDGQPQHYHVTTETHDRQSSTQDPVRSGDEDIEIALKTIWPSWKRPKAVIRRVLGKK